MLLFLVSCAEKLPEDLAAFEDQLPDRIDFNFHIKPILSDRCFQCHGPDANQRKAELRLDTKAGAFAQSTGTTSVSSSILTPGKLRNSELFLRIISDDPDYVMPTPESNLALTDREKALIAKWILQGADYQPHWSFIPPQKSKKPTVFAKDWPIQDLDYYILNKIEEHELLPAAQAAKLTLLRRVTLDLTGLPPTPQEIDTFLGDKRPDAYAKVVDRLLESPHYGERMALEWLDVARYADSHGYQDDGMRNTWPWRDWVIEAFNSNMPYDSFLIAQLAGDLLPAPSKEQLLATCFNRNHPQTQEGGVVDEEYRVEYVADRTNTLGKAIMGLTLECARCHDHKYDPITQKDYYSLYAFFNNNNDTGIVPYNGEASPTVMLPTDEEQKKLDSLRAKIDLLEKEALSKRYVEDFKKWMTQEQDELTLKTGLVAAFDFDQAIDYPRNKLNLDGNKSPGWAGIGKKGTITSYINEVKQKPDAVIFGDVDRKPLVSEGKVGNGLEFRGDCGVRFNRDLDFDRDQPFSVSIWVNPLKAREKGPIFNKTNGDFEGYRGWICKLNEDGTLSFQLNHVWPDNSIDYQTKDTLEVGKWSHIAMVYDGSSKADGLKFYINGKVPAHKLLRDNLNKSLLHGVKGSNWSNLPLLLGKEKERTIENFRMDELLVYNRQLSEIEVKTLYNDNGPLEYNQTQWQEYYLLSGQSFEYNAVLKQLQVLRKEENLLATDVLEVMVMQERKDPRPTFILDRGMYDAPAEEVLPEVPAIFESIPDHLPKNRMGLSLWLVSEKNPLTARVQVNRMWKMLFGKGLVATQEDFGNQGSLPSHPELLDYLAIQFMELNWNMKAFLKSIILSATYRQSALTHEETREKDPLNAWYASFPTYRLSAEVIRDNALAISGLLVDSIGGPSVYPYQPKGLWKALATRNATEYKQGAGADLYRRSLYTIWKRSAPPPSMMSFDAPDRYYCIVNRQNTATPLQSLILMNDPQYVEAARVLGERTLNHGGETSEQRIDYLFKCALSRLPDREETSLMQQLLNETQLDFKNHPAKIRGLLETGESIADKSLDAIELAAFTVLASTIINFDEFVMKI